MPEPELLLPVDDGGLLVSAGIKASPAANGAYVTPLGTGVAGAIPRFLPLRFREVN